MGHFEEYKKQGEPGTFNLSEIPESSKRGPRKNEKTTQKILEFLKDNPQATRKELADLIDLRTG